MTTAYFGLTMVMASGTMQRFLALALVLAGAGAFAFQPHALRRPVSPVRVADVRHFGPRVDPTTIPRIHQDATILKASRLVQVPENNDRVKRFSIRRYLGRKFQRVAVLLQSFFRACLRLSFALSLLFAASMVAVQPQPAEASAPVMVMPKGEGRDPIMEAVAEHKRAQVKAQQDENKAFAAKCRQIEATEGEAARVRFEKEFKQQKIREAEEKEKGLEQLKRNLLDQGIDPFCDMEGQRQVTFYKEGVDLGEVAGTPFNLESVLQSRNSKQSNAYRLLNHRKIVALMAQDMRNRGIDPLEYFSTHQDNTIAILELSGERAAELAARYEANMEAYGQLRAPAEGELSVKEQLAKNPKSKLQRKVAAKFDQSKAKVNKVAAKVEQKKEKIAPKVQEKKREVVSEAKSAVEAIVPDVEEVSKVVQSAKAKTKSSSQIASKAVPAAAAFVAVGGGGYAFKVYRDKAARDEEERQRQFRLIMGDAADTDTKKPKASSSLDEDELDLDSFNGSKSAPKASSAPAPTPAPVKLPLEPAPKKKRMGLKGVFSRNKSGRETDISVLVAPDAEAPEFAKLLAKLLTFGAPGRFPRVQALPGDMPMAEFDLEGAKEMLIAAREKADLDLVSSAEIFANVVNCMLIDIIDLASATLKEKDTKIQVEALDVAIKFIEHAASMYDAVAEGVIISPVTYEGDLGRGKLESMYSAYAGSMMSNPKDDFDSRLQSLQDIFKISDKKAEGLMMSAVQKNMMEMMKNGEGMEGMEEMLAGMGGMAGGLEGMTNPDGELDLQQVKQMLIASKQLKDSGAFSKEDIEAIRKEFNQTFGTTIDEMADPLDEETKEILELMKSIFDD